MVTEGIQDDWFFFLTLRIDFIQFSSNPVVLSFCQKEFSYLLRAFAFFFHFINNDDANDKKCIWPLTQDITPSFGKKVGLTVERVDVPWQIQIKEARQGLFSSFNSEER